MELTFDFEVSCIPMLPPGATIRGLPNIFYVKTAISNLCGRTLVGPLPIYYCHKTEKSVRSVFTGYMKIGNSADKATSRVGEVGRLLLDFIITWRGLSRRARGIFCNMVKISY